MSARCLLVRLAMPRATSDDHSKQQKVGYLHSSEERVLPCGENTSLNRLGPVCSRPLKCTVAYWLQESILATVAERSANRFF
jgi:hypothetical protein